MKIIQKVHVSHHTPLVTVVLFVVAMLILFLVTTPLMIEKAFEDQNELHVLETSFLNAEYQRVRGMTSPREEVISRLSESTESLTSHPLLVQMRKTDEDFDAGLQRLESSLDIYLRHLRNDSPGLVTQRLVHDIRSSVGELHDYMHTHGMNQIYTLQMSNVFILLMVIILSSAMVYTELRRRRELQLKEGLRSLNRKTLSELEEERRQINYTIHDHVLQDLEMVRKHFETLDRATFPDSLRTTFSRVEQAVMDSITNLRGILEGLPVWDTVSFSFEDNIRNVTEKIGSMMNAKLHLSTIGLPMAPLSSRETEQLLSILQETLHNAAKHSGAENVKIKALWAHPRLRLIVEDDGEGFRVRNIHEGKADTLGLLSMRERVDTIGAQLFVESTPGKGTRITVELTKGEKNEE